MKHLTLIILGILFSIEAFSTVQGPDVFIWEKDTLYLFSTPLELHPDIETLRDKLFGDQKTCLSTAYWRGYRAVWKLIGKELFLVNIYSPCYRKSVKADLANLFPKRYQDGKVKVDWVSDELWINEGAIFKGWLGLYSYEIGLSFEKGILTKIEEYNNSKAQKSVYTQNSDSLLQFIYSHINWNEFPDSIEGSKEVYVSIQGNESGKIGKVSIKRANNVDLIREAVRVVKLIPEWDVYYRQGKFFPMTQNCLIQFSDRNRQKYAR